MKGIYVLVIELSKNTDILVGKLGTLHFNRGLYAYVGSAQVALEKRIERHLKKNERIFWHIDYLLQNPSSRILEVFTSKAPKSDECRVAKKLAQYGKNIADFGCSDCKCDSHLFQLKDWAFLYEFMNRYSLSSPSESS